MAAEIKTRIHESFLAYHGLDTVIPPVRMQHLAVRAWLMRLIQSSGLSKSKLAQQVAVEDEVWQANGILKKYLDDGRPSPNLHPYPRDADMIDGKRQPLLLRLEKLDPGSIKILLHPLWLLLAIPRDVEHALKVSAECCSQVRKVFLDENLQINRKSHFKDELPGVFPGMRIPYRAVTCPEASVCPYGAVAAFLLYVLLCRSGRMGYEGYRSYEDCPPKALFRGDPMRRSTLLVDKWYPVAMSKVKADADPLVDQLPTGFREEVRLLVQDVIDSQPIPGPHCSSMRTFVSNSWANDEESWIRQDAMRFLRAFKGNPEDSKELDQDIRQAVLRLHDYRVRKSLFLGA